MDKFMKTASKFSDIEVKSSAKVGIVKKNKQFLIKPNEEVIKDSFFDKIEYTDIQNKFKVTDNNIVKYYILTDDYKLIEINEK